MDTALGVAALHVPGAAEIVERLYSSDGWEGVGEEAPDEVDLQMIREAQTDPDCAIFASDGTLSSKETNQQAGSASPLPMRSATSS